MGRRRRHIKKFDGGRRSPEEVHAHYAFPPGARCAGCGRRPTVRAIVMYPVQEARQQIEAIDAMAETQPQKLLEILVPIRGSDGKPEPYLRVSKTYSCESCRPAMEHVLAKNTPSYAIVEINRASKLNPKVITS